MKKLLKILSGKFSNGMFLKMPVFKGRERKETVKKIWGYLFEIFIWFIYLWMGAISIACACMLPKQGIITLVGAIGLTFVPRIYKKYRKSEEE